MEAIFPLNRRSSCIAIGDVDEPSPQITVKGDVIKQYIKPSLKPLGMLRMITKFTVRIG